MSQITMQPPDIKTLLSDGLHFAERKGDMIHIINALTAHTAIIFPAIPTPTPVTFVQQQQPSGEITWVPSDRQDVVTIDRLKVYNPAIIDIICSRIVEGASLSEICRQPDMPTYATLCRWRRREPWITEVLEQARRDRAEYLRDQALSEALAADEDNAAAKRLVVDTYKWAASTDDPARYSPKTKVDATLAVATQILVDTGIDRAPLEREASTVQPQIEGAENAKD